MATTHRKADTWYGLASFLDSHNSPVSQVPPSRVLDSSNVFTPSGSIESFSSQEPQDIPDSSTNNSLPSLKNLDLSSFSFRWDLGLDCEDEDGSVSDYGTVLHTGEASLSAPLTTATGLSAVEEITEGGLTDSRTTSTTNQISFGVRPSDTGLPSHNCKDLGATKDAKNILGRLRAAMVSDRLVSRLSVPWSVFIPAPPMANVPINSSEKASAALRPRPRNKLRKKTRPSIAITLTVEPPSSFSLTDPQNRPFQPLGALQTGTNLTSVSPVAGFPSTKSFLSFQLPPVFSRARSKVLQKSTYRPPNDMGVFNRISAMHRPDVESSGTQARKSGSPVSRDSQQPAKDNERAVPVADSGIGGFPTPIRVDGQRGDPREEIPARGRPNRISTSWELGLGLGQQLGLRVCSLWRVRAE